MKSFSHAVRLKRCSFWRKQRCSSHLRFIRILSCQIKDHLSDIDHIMCWSEGLIMCALGAVWRAWFRAFLCIAQMYNASVLLQSSERVDCLTGVLIFYSVYNKVYLLFFLEKKVPLKTDASLQKKKKKKNLNNHYRWDHLNKYLTTWRHSTARLPLTAVNTSWGPLASGVVHFLNAFGITRLGEIPDMIPLSTFTSLGNVSRRRRASRPEPVVARLSRENIYSPGSYSMRGVWECLTLFALCHHIYLGYCLTVEMYK